MNLLAATYDNTISDIEIVWTLIAVMGFFFALANVRDSLRDMKLIDNRTNGRRIIAQFSTRIELSRCLIQAIFVAVGVLAMTIPEPPDQLEQPWNYALLGIIFRWGLIISASLLALNSYWSYRSRRELEQVIEAERAGHLL